MSNRQRALSVYSRSQSICIQPTCPISEPAHLEKLIIKIVTELAGFKTPDAS